MRLEDVKVSNAAGYRKKGLDGACELVRCGGTAITLGSYKLNPRQGNCRPEGYTGDTFWVGESGDALNSRGIPCPSFEELCGMLPEIAEVAAGASKELRINIEGMPSDLEIMFDLLSKVKLTHALATLVIEVNLGCPNLIGKGVMSADSELVGQCLGVIEDADWNENTRFDLKVSPLIHEPLVLQVAREVMKYGSMIDSIVTANTLPNMRLFNFHGESHIAACAQDGDAAGTITDKGGYSGGDVMFGIALNEIEMWRGLLADKNNVIGVGGVRRGFHLAKMFEYGVREVQVGTAVIASENPGVISEILEEFADIGVLEN